MGVQMTAVPLPVTVIVVEVEMVLGEAGVVQVRGIPEMITE
jgi:hypothetical protein